MGSTGAFVLGASCSTGLGRAFAFASEHVALDLEAYGDQSYASTCAFLTWRLDHLGPFSSDVAVRAWRRAKGFDFPDRRSYRRPAERRRSGSDLRRAIAPA